MSAVFFGFPVKKHLELMPQNDLRRQLKMVLKYYFRPCVNCGLYNICILNALLPSVILSYAKNKSTYCFRFQFYFMCTKKKKKHVLWQTKHHCAAFSQQINHTANHQELGKKEKIFCTQGTIFENSTSCKQHCRTEPSETKHSRKSSHSFTVPPLVGKIQTKLLP